MKIGIVTFWFADNFGALLQNKATQEILKKYNYEAITIKFKPNYKKRKNILFIIQRVINKILNLSALKIKNLMYRNKIKEMNSLKSKKFKEFRENNIIYSSEIKNINEIDKIAQCSLYICGSDQIWNPGSLSSEAAKDFYFLNFCNNKKKIAYAPSIAVKNIPKKMRIFYENELAKFDFLSTRESRGVEIIKELTGKDAKLVLDPTLLLEGKEWRIISKDIKRKKYIFAYFLGMTEEANLSMKKFAKKNNLEIILIKYDHEKIYLDFEKKDAIGVDEFLGYIDSADYIFTDSFHGVVFSILFNKKFYVFNRSEKLMNNMSSRILNILTCLDLKERFIEKNINKSLEIKEIDYKKVEEKLKKLREGSLEYLLNAINIASKK